MATEPINQSRITKIREAGKFQDEGEFGMVLDLALEQITAKHVVDHAIKALRTSLAEETAKLQKVAARLATTEDALKQNMNDMAIADNYIDILRRGLKDAVARERVFSKYYDQFVAGVHHCIDRTELPKEVIANPTLLRLQETLDAKNDK